MYTTGCVVKRATKLCGNESTMADDEALWL